MCACPGSAVAEGACHDVPVLLVSANVNGIRAAARRGGLAWLEAAAPDVLTLQEVRASDAELHAALAGSVFEGWHVAHSVSAVKGRAGVASPRRFRAIDPVRPAAGDYCDSGSKRKTHKGPTVEGTAAW